MWAVRLTVEKNQFLCYTIYNIQYVYILFSLKDSKLYIGCTNNLKRRLQEHNIGKVDFTKYRRPLNLIYLEGCLNEKDAYKREKYFKMDTVEDLLKTD